VARYERESTTIAIESVEADAKGLAYLTDNRTVEQRTDHLRRERILPGSHTLDTVARYETHLERSLFRTVRELHRLQAARKIVETAA
jgi:hypothetical protein